MNEPTPTPTRVIFARVPINLYTRLTRRAKKWGGKGRKSVNQVAVVALAEWCERQEEAEMSGSKLANELETKNPSCSSQSFGSD